jgi:hypothetical protein
MTVVERLPGFIPPMLADQRRVGVGFDEAWTSALGEALEGERALRAKRWRRAGGVA